MTERELENAPEQASSKSNMDTWKFTDILPGGFLKRHSKGLIGGLALLGIAGGAGYLIYESMQPEPQQEISVGKTICPADETRDGVSTSIDFDGQDFTFGTGTEVTEVLVRLTADRNGEIYDIEPIDGLKDRKEGSSESEIIEIYEPNGQGSEDDVVRMSVWYEPAGLVVSVPCE